MWRRQSTKAGSKFKVTQRVGKRDREALVIASTPRVQKFQARGMNSNSVYQPPRKREMKFVDTSSAQNPAVAGTGTLSAGLILLTAGTAASNNIVGQECTVKSMQWRQAVSMAPTTTGNGAIRTVIVYDKSPHGAAPTIFGTSASDIFNADNINAQQALQNRDRFIILQDIITTSVGLAGPGADYQKGFRTLSLPQVYDVPNGTVNKCMIGNIVAVTWASPGFATAAPVVTLETRFRYEDA